MAAGADLGHETVNVAMHRIRLARTLGTPIVPTRSVKNLPIAVD